MAIEVFERFTDRARRVVVLAQEEARMLNHNYIGTEHILLGLIHEGEGVAARALVRLGISVERVRQQVEEIIGQGQQEPGGYIPFTPRGKKVLELSLREALQLGHNYIGTEHILLGLIREGEGVAAQVLVKLGADLSRVRQQVIQLLAGNQGKEPAADGTGAPGDAEPALVGGQRSDMERLIRVLCGRRPNNPLLVGPPGSGKTFLVDALFRYLAQHCEDVGSLRWQLMPLNGPELLAGNDPDRLRKRVDKLLDDIRANRLGVLLLEDLPATVVADQGGIFLDRLTQELADGHARVVAMTSDPSTEAVEQAMTHLAGHLVPVPICPFEPEDAVEALTKARTGLEHRHQVVITENAVKTAVELAPLHEPDRALPGSAVALLGDTAQHAQLTRWLRTTDGPVEVNEDAVRQLVELEGSLAR